MTTARTERTALIVDDEDQLLRLMTRVLEKEGARVLAAKDAEEARELFTAHENEIASGGSPSSACRYSATRPARSRDSPSLSP